MLPSSVTYNTVVGSPIPVGYSPSGLAITSDGTRAYVVNGLSGDVSVINTATNTVVNTIRVGNHPHTVAITPGPISKEQCKKRRLEKFRLQESGPMHQVR